MTSAIVPQPTQDLATPVKRPGFLDGTVAFFSGFGFILKTPEMWLLALVPGALVVAVTGGLSALAIEIVSPRITALVSIHWLAAIVKGVAYLLSVLVALAVSFAIAQPLSGPALNRIVRRAEASVGAPESPPTTFGEDMLRALYSVLLSYAFGIPLLLLLYVITFFFPPAAVVTFPLKVVVLAILAAWDLCDYPLSAHGMPVGERAALMGRNIAAMIGFGLGVGLLSVLLPCTVIFVLPAGVAGAARLTVAIERAEAARRA